RGGVTRGGDEDIDLGEKLVEALLHEAAETHGFEVILGGGFEGGFETRGLRGVGKLVDFAAGDEFLEDRRLFGVEDGGEGGSVGEGGELLFDEGDAGLFEGVERGAEGG